MTARPTTVVRDRVIAVLSDAFAAGTLEVEEFERRVTVAHRSDAVAEVEALIADLPAPAAPAAPPVASRALVPASEVRDTGLVLSLMGGAQRTGRWSVPRVTYVVSVMGGSRLDLREARLPAGTVEVRALSMMGGVEIIVPPNLAVEANGVGIMGGFEHVERVPTDPDPGAPLLRVTGVAIMGGVNIEMRLPGESAREAKRRRKRERKQERLQERVQARLDRRRP
jgi:hypothetical protein